MSKVMVRPDLHSTWIHLAAPRRTGCRTDCSKGKSKETERQKAVAVVLVKGELKDMENIHLLLDDREYGGCRN